MGWDSFGDMFDGGGMGGSSDRGYSSKDHSDYKDDYENAFGHSDPTARDHGSADGGNEGNEGNEGDGWSRFNGDYSSSNTTTSNSNSVSTSQGTVVVSSVGHTQVTTASGTKINFDIQLGTKQATIEKVVQTAVDFANAVGNGSLHAQRKVAELTVQVTDVPNSSFNGAYHSGHVTLDTKVGAFGKWSRTDDEIAGTLVHELSHAYNPTLHETNTPATQNSHHAFEFQQYVDHAGNVIGIDASASGTGHRVADSNRLHHDTNISNTVSDQSESNFSSIQVHHPTSDAPQPHIHYSVHYNEYGFHTDSDALEYIASYGDLMNAFGANGEAGVNHFLNHGIHEGREIVFDGLEYVASYGDLMNAFGADVVAGATHFINAGRHEGRTTTFDGLEYIASYDDLINAFGADASSGARHYIVAGRDEGRTTTFDGLEYIASYDDLIFAFGSDSDAGATHFIVQGNNEGRETTFDVEQYLANYADLNAAFGNDHDPATIHYIDQGFFEDRTDDFLFI
jgi:hypothetical protein